MFDKNLIWTKLKVISRPLALQNKRCIILICKVYSTT